MQPSETERLLLASIKKADHILLLRQKYGITSSHFPYYPDESKFIWDYVLQYGIPPDSSLLLLQFPEFDTTGTDNFEWIAEEFDKVNITRQAAIIFYKGQEALEKDPYAALPLVMSQLGKLATVEEEHRNVLDAEASKNRLERYQRIATNVEEASFKLGIEPLDAIPLRIKPNQLIGLIANTGVGKSWFMVKIAAEFYQAGKRVLFVSPELSNEELELREDVVLGRIMGYTFSHDALMFGRPIPISQYEEFLSKIGGRNDWVNYDASSDDKLGVSFLSALVQKEKPDVLVIDGIQFMDDEERSYTSWEKMKSICKGLKRLAMKEKIIVFAVAQANRESAKHLGAAKMSEVADGYDFARFVDLLLSLGRVEGAGPVREIMVEKVRSGKEIPQAFQVTFDPDVGDIGRATSKSMGEANITL